MIYSFENQKTGDQFELEMTYDQLKVYLENNPQVFQTFKMNVVDPVGIGVTKPPTDFSKHVLGRIKDNHPLGGAIERRYSIPKEI
jgi:hypothetical protein